MFPSHGSQCVCGKALLDGHLTCGEARCGTQAEAEARLRTKPTFRVNTGPARIFRGECILCGSQWHRTSQCPENDL